MSHHGPIAYKVLQWNPGRSSPGFCASVTGIHTAKSVASISRIA